jgi:DNA-binding MarR family transcriptional regulator
VHCIAPKQKNLGESMAGQTRAAMLNDIAFQLMRMSKKMVELHSQPKDFGCGVLLFPAEVHTLSAVYENPRSSITELSELLGVTKGAASQMISKMEKKSLIIKEFAPGSEKQRMLKLTEKGKLAYNGHEEYHKQMVIEVDKKMESLSIDDLKQYRQVNRLVEELIEELQ